MEIIPFEFDAHQVRVVQGDDGEPWFVASDIAKALGYTNPMKAVRDHCKGVNVSFTPTAGGAQQVKTIREPDVYRLIMRSKLPSAERFEAWVFEEVLPSIRRHGGYLAGQEDTDDPELIIAKALQVAQGVIERKSQELAAAQHRISQQRPKVEFYDQVAGSKDAIDLGRAAKVLNIRGMGRNKLFQFLRGEKILQTNNLPYQQHIDAGHFRVIEQRYSRPNGEIAINMKTMVYQKGLDYIRKRVEKAREGGAAV